MEPAYSFWSPRLAAVPDPWRSARHRAYRYLQPYLVIWLLSERRDCCSRICDSLFRVGVEHYCARSARRGARSGGRCPVEWGESLANAPLCAFATDWTAGGGGLVCGFPALPLGCGIHDPGDTSRWRNA